ncbi:hypothetical protein SAMN04488063_0394 [Halopelagius inordinatus]|uniref:Uncharacterized protein n=1 Tax=Halopelagius inordinatus TaxID=553467 RepID=A0A1I2LWN2_9EURY|nr:hypothetical protein [Halopelagius inordinatus]SFF81391.1 hypothetical protein SAMN04488063_0394 [Halopelagius inordinatus]
MDDRLERFIRDKFRAAGRKYARTKRAYDEGRTDADGGFDLPRDDEGRTKLVCRRYAERRSVAVDDDGRPECFEAGHPDCVGCAEDIRTGVVETW